MSLLAIAAGIKKKGSVNKIVMKFPPSDFVVMFFHYDGIVDAWRDLEWSSHAFHVSSVYLNLMVVHKTFLTSRYYFGLCYIFLWDEDLGVNNFNAERYISIVKEEGLEISQPALDPDKSELHHHLICKTTKQQEDSQVD